MPLQATSGAASYDGFGGGVVAEPNYIESVFSTYLYTGNGSTQTITNGIDLSTKGGLVWIKSRSSGSEYHVLQDTVRGRGHVLSSNTTDQSFSSSAGESITTYNSNGFSLGINRSATQAVNTNAATYVSWTFREQPKFFDVVTYTGDGLGKTIPHNLGSTPGCILIKRTDAAAEWRVFHRSLNDQYLVLNSTAARVDMSGATLITCTSTTFYVGENAALCANGGTYVAYLFAHDAGGFGLTGTDNVISCGSYTTDGSSNSAVTLGWEPQWLITKRVNSASSWAIIDNMRGVPNGGTTLELMAEGSFAESTASGRRFLADGFSFTGRGSPGDTWIYIAIRRGPMAVPTVGTSVFSTSVSSADTGVITSGFVTDMALTLDRTSSGVAPYDRAAVDRLRGNFKNLSTANTNAEVNNTSTVSFQQNNGIYLNGGGVYANGYVYEQFKRAPGFFDEVCYLGTGANRTVAHNLGAAPELMIVKRRDTAGYNWNVYLSTLGASSGLWLNDTTGELTGVVYWNSTSPTSSVFSIGSNVQVNASGGTYVAYLFATCAGVSKVGSYTGTGTLTTIDCGFTGGARFVLIKRTDSAASWYVWDTARGMVSGTDPSLQLNWTSGEVNGDSIFTVSTGFQIVASPFVDVNSSGGTYIFLAIA